MTRADLADPAASQVVLIGATTYSHLPPLPAVAGNVSSLAEALRDEALWGLPAENCHVVLDEASPREVGRTIRTAAAAVGEGGLLLIYYAGHGLIDPINGQLILALAECEPEVPDEAGLPYDWIGRALAGSAATRRAVILDCCYAGRADNLMSAAQGGTDEVADVAELDRTCLFVSAPSNRRAAAPEGEPYTAFTGELLRVLRDGVPGGEPVLTMAAIWRRVRTALTARGFERPELRERNAGGSFGLVRNAALSKENLAGVVLRAGRGVADRDLAGGRILVLAHDETGAAGIDLYGHPAPLPDEFTPAWREQLSDPVVRYGGPVARDGYIALARLWPTLPPPPRFRPIKDRLGVLSLTAPPDELRHTFAWVRVFSGYFGWAPGELESYLDGGVLVRTHEGIADLRGDL
ncbi:caspase, EACC1-associated type [Catenuloplanes atrovinosus]|uniref:Transcriptional regulator n=1 Tax=Catenuloplanes atrovinosus TaxID=137266 RepID=A0AAE4CCE6_9ACTN|nr:caspase family protein [Catenuloplanes atrovinosus]MDR7276450.1 putative transcriptional regulator [Catenuloplanes atrovinosus]